MLNLVFADYVDADNLLAILASIKQEKTAVVLTGRPAATDEESPIDEYDVKYSVDLLAGAAEWYSRFLKNLGSDVKIFYGGLAAKTLIPHGRHSKELDIFSGFNADSRFVFGTLSDFTNLIRESGGVRILLAGPATGIEQVFYKHADLVGQVREIHAMYGTWGNVELMSLGDSKPRGTKQFNVACDTEAGKWMLETFKDIPKWFYTTDTTRVSSIGFSDIERMRSIVGSDSEVSKAMMSQYEVWYNLAVRPRQEKNPNEMIFTHDFCVSLYDEPNIYEWERVIATIDDDGNMLFQKSEISSIYASKAIVKPERYLQRLKEVLG